MNTQPSYGWAGLQMCSGSLESRLSIAMRRLSKRTIASGTLGRASLLLPRWTRLAMLAWLDWHGNLMTLAMANRPRLVVSSVSVLWTVVSLGYRVDSINLNVSTWYIPVDVDTFKLISNERSVGSTVLTKEGIESLKRLLREHWGELINFKYTPRARESFDGSLSRIQPQAPVAFCEKVSNGKRKEYKENIKRTSCLE